MIDTIIEFLKKKLFFELNAFKYFIVMLIDNLVNLRFDQNFFDDFRNELHAIRN